MIRYIWLFALVLAACSTEQHPQHKKRTVVRCLDAQAGGQAVITDHDDNFFELLRAGEICVQLQLSAADCDSFKRKERGTQINEYKEFIQKDALDFSEEERQRADQQMQAALQLCYGVFPKLPLPDTIDLIKTKSAYYGPTVFYTRGNNIIIPAPALAEGAEEHLRDVLIHEIFHIYSRRNGAKRQALFARIGFKPIETLELSPFLEERIFYNPDATDCRYAIRLEEAGRSFWAVPIIYNRFGEYQAGMSFFQHLLFQLFEVEEQADGSFKIVAPDVGLEPSACPSFFKQISRNTGYIIHPEEIIADNFKMIVLSQLRNQAPQDSRLLEDIGKIIAQ